MFSLQCIYAIFALQNKRRTQSTIEKNIYGVFRFWVFSQSPNNLSSFFPKLFKETVLGFSELALVLVFIGISLKSLLF